MVTRQNICYFYLLFISFLYFSYIKHRKLYYRDLALLGKWSRKSRFIYAHHLFYLFISLTCTTYREHFYPDTPLLTKSVTRVMRQVTVYNYRPSSHII